MPEISATGSVVQLIQPKKMVVTVDSRTIEVKVEMSRGEHVFYDLK